MYQKNKFLGMDVQATVWVRERERDQPYLGKDLLHLDFLISPKQPVSTQLWV